MNTPAGEPGHTYFKPDPPQIISPDIDKELELLSQVMTALLLIVKIKLTPRIVIDGK